MRKYFNTFQIEKFKSN